MSGWLGSPGHLRGLEALSAIATLLESSPGPAGVVNDGWRDGYRVWRGRHTGRFVPMIQTSDGIEILALRDTEAEAAQDARARLGLAAPEPEPPPDESEGVWFD